MSAYGGNVNNDYWNNSQPPQEQNYNFEMAEPFGQELNFQTFDSSQQFTAAPSTFEQSSYSGTFLDPSGSTNTPYSNDSFPQGPAYNASAGGTDFDDEPPLLEELGINPNHIFQKTLSVLNPFRSTEQAIFQDTDMAGPLVFCLAFGGFLLLRGKVSFSYIYGIGVLGCLAFYALLSLMATKTNVTLGAVISVLGYCLLPMVALSGVNVLITIQGIIGTVLTGVCILWCSVSASKLFVTALSMDHQQVLIAYPCALLYGVFALITVF